MKPSVLVTAIIFAGFASASLASLTKTSDRNWLTGADEQTRFERLEHYLGGFSSVMQETGLRYGHVEQAIADENWDLALYHWEKIGVAIENGLMKRPARRPNAEAIFLESAWGDLDEALKGKNRGTIQDAFKSARDACMNCHAAEDVPFINDQPLFRHLPVQTMTLIIPQDAQVCEDVGEHAQADAPDDREALRDIKIGRIFWDVTIADPVQLLGRLEVIEKTHRDMVHQDVRPEMILAFRGGSVRLLTDLENVGPEHRAGAAEVQAKLRTLLALPGVRMESCYIAMRRVPLGSGELMEGIEAVGNTFLSAMGYGQKGYVSIPIH
jgi:hypothetical protein